MSLDYQMAVRFASATSSSAGDVAGAWNALSGKIRSDITLANQFDVQGHTMPSMVANSQWHIGQDVLVQIEDQPLLRGDIIKLVVDSWLAGKGGKLLQNHYGINDFGDTIALFCYMTH